VDHTLQFYIDGRWVAPLTSATLDVINRPTIASPAAPSFFMPVPPFWVFSLAKHSFVVWGHSTGLGGLQ
jgi:hypothetical protein